MVAPVVDVIQWLDLEIDGVLRRVPAAKAAGRLWYHWEGQTYVVEVAAGRGRARAQRTMGEPGVVTAPMPGKITRVAIERGADVTKDQVLVVMEAMKMEYTLATDVAGFVSELSATVGATVGQGDVLVKVTPK